MHPTASRGATQGGICTYNPKYVTCRPIESLVNDILIGGNDAIATESA